MKNRHLLFSCLVMAVAVLFICGCGSEGGESAEKKEVQLSDKGKLLASKSWKLSVNEVLNDATSQVDSATGIEADIQLDGDVGKFADFVAETLTFAKDENDPTKLAYERKVGEGFLSASVVGYWEFNEDETAIIMREWDSEAGKEKEPVTYEIVKLTEDKLILKKEGDAVPNIYNPKE